MRPSRRLSEVLGALAEQDAVEISLADLLSAFGDRAFGAFMLVFAAPNLLPLPPGSSAVLGLPLIIVAAQLALGLRVLWLPKFIRRRSLPRETFRRLAGAVAAHLPRVERILRPRLAALTGPVPDRLIGLAVFVLAVILFLPIPGGNILPGLAITAFSLGLIERDGLAIAFAWLATVVSLTVVAAVIGVAVAAVKAFVQGVVAYLGL